VRWPVVGLLVLVALSGAAPQGGKKRQKQASSGRRSTTTSTTAAPDPVYWWLEGEVSPFGGRNYNIQEVQRGEHIRKEEVKVKPRSGGRDVKKITKRQADYSEDDYSDYDDSYYYADDYYYESDSLARQVEFDESDTEGGVIALNEIESECPAGSSCIETFFCKQISGSSLRDKIPCLLTSGQFAGDFGVCCRERHPRVCPKVRTRPDPEDCAHRPLGDPEDEECDITGERSLCPRDNLCCFNGCINVCLADPPHTVQTAFWQRQPAEEVERRPLGGGGWEGDGMEYRDEYDDTSEEEDYAYYDEEAEEDVITEVFKEFDDLSETDRVLLKLIKRLTRRISS